MMEQCRKCGKCLNVCPVYQLGYSSFAVFPLYGPEKADVWQCSNCWLCHLECPEQIDLWSVKVKLQRSGVHVPDRVQAGYDQLAACGFILPLTEEINVLRADRGLPLFKLPDREVVHFLLDTGW